MIIVAIGAVHVGLDGARISVSGHSMMRLIEARLSEDVMKPARSECPDSFDKASMIDALVPGF